MPEGFRGVRQQGWPVAERLALEWLAAAAQPGGRGTQASPELLAESFMCAMGLDPDGDMAAISKLLGITSVELGAVADSRLGYILTPVVLMANAYGTALRFAMDQPHLGLSDVLISDTVVETRNMPEDVQRMLTIGNLGMRLNLLYAARELALDFAGVPRPFWMADQPSARLTAVRSPMTHDLTVMDHAMGPLPFVESGLTPGFRASGAAISDNWQRSVRSFPPQSHWVRGLSPDTSQARDEFFRALRPATQAEYDAALANYVVKGGRNAPVALTTLEFQSGRVVSRAPQRELLGMWYTDARLMVPAYNDVDLKKTAFTLLEGPDARVEWNVLPGGMSVLGKDGMFESGWASHNAPFLHENSVAWALVPVGYDLAREDPELTADMSTDTHRAL
jgi:hypothetical protein